jgi:hypothetical protein
MHYYIIIEMIILNKKREIKTIFRKCNRVMIDYFYYNTNTPLLCNHLFNFIIQKTANYGSIMIWI